MMEIKTGRGYVGKDSEVRHVIIMAAVGRGQTVLWDSVPLDRDYDWETTARQKRPHGRMPLRAFQKWAKGAQG